ncbi:MAG: outer membrane beta-barrel protein [Gammaproteobacteria bacterium]
MYTDNAKLTDNNEDSDEIFVGLVGAQISERDGPFRADANTSMTYEHYFDHTYGDKHWFNLNANAGWEMIRDRVDWGVSDYFTQTQINNLDSDTPDNNQNTNAFALGPTVFIPVSGRQTITLRPLFSDFYYENTDTDNRQYGLTADWLYQLYPDMKTGVSGGATAVRYKKDDRNPDYSIYNLGWVVTGTRPSSQYRIELGGTNINRDKVGNQNGFRSNLSWLYNITGHSSVQAYAATDLTDSSQEYLNSQIDPATGDYGNVQTSGDVLRNKIFRLGYNRKDSTLNSNIWTEFRDLDYKESPDDRKVKEVGAQLDYQMTATVTTGVYGKYNKTKETDMSNDYKYYSTGVTAGYRLSRKLSTRFDLRYQKKDSNVDTNQYTEYSAFLGLVYGFGQVPTPDRYDYGGY